MPVPVWCFGSQVSTPSGSPGSAQTSVVPCGLDTMVPCSVGLQAPGAAWAVPGGPASIFVVCLLYCVSWRWCHGALLIPGDQVLRNVRSRWPLNRTGPLPAWLRYLSASSQHLFLHCPANIVVHPVGVRLSNEYLGSWSHVLGPTSTPVPPPGGAVPVMSFPPRGGRVRFGTIVFHTVFGWMTGLTEPSSLLLLLIDLLRPVLALLRAGLDYSCTRCCSLPSRFDWWCGTRSFFASVPYQTAWGCGPCLRGGYLTPHLGTI